METAVSVFVHRSDFLFIFLCDYIGRTIENQMESVLCNTCTPALFTMNRYSS